MCGVVKCIHRLGINAQTIKIHTLEYKLYIWIQTCGAEKMGHYLLAFVYIEFLYKSKDETVYFCTCKKLSLQISQECINFFPCTTVQCTPITI